MLCLRMLSLTLGRMGLDGPPPPPPPPPPPLSPSMGQTPRTSLAYWLPLLDAFMLLDLMIHMTYGRWRKCVGGDP